MMYRLLSVARILKANFRNKHLILPYDDLKKIYFIFFLLSLLSKKFSPNNFDTLKLHFPAIFGANFVLKKLGKLRSVVGKRLSKRKQTKKGRGKEHLS